MCGPQAPGWRLPLGDDKREGARQQEGLVSIQARAESLSKAAELVTCESTVERPILCLVKAWSPKHSEAQNRGRNGGSRVPFDRNGHRAVEGRLLAFMGLFCLSDGR